jgi:predicted RNase H-like HicB family nuclease
MEEARAEARDKTRAEMSARRYAIVIEPTGTGYSAYSPDVLGCVAVGDSEEETRRDFQDALREHFEALREVGEAGLVFVGEC